MEETPPSDSETPIEESLETPIETTQETVTTLATTDKDPKKPNPFKQKNAEKLAAIRDSVNRKKEEVHDKERKHSIQREKLRLKILQQCKQIREEKIEFQDEVDMPIFRDGPPKKLTKIRSDSAMKDRKRSNTIEKTFSGYETQKVLANFKLLP